MIKKLSLIFVFLFLIGSVFALPDGAGSHFDKAVSVDSDGAVVKSPNFFEKLLQGFDIGGFTGPRGEGVFDADWVSGEKIYILYDEETFATWCNDAVPVVEFYQNGFVGAVEGQHDFLPLKRGVTKSFVGQFVFDAVDKASTTKNDIYARKLGLGDWIAVDYVVCRSPDYLSVTGAKDRVVNGRVVDARILQFQPNEYRFVVRSEAEVEAMRSGEVSCEIPDGPSGDPYCAGGNVVRKSYSDCESGLETVKVCSDRCYSGKCYSDEEVTTPPCVGCDGPPPLDDGDGGSSGAVDEQNNNVGGGGFEFDVLWLIVGVLALLVIIVTIILLVMK